MSGFPYIFAFYSFKGGVGRSMSLLNAAYALAGRGRHVLMLDMDLEAPGLSGFLKRTEEVTANSKSDIVDLLNWARLTARDLPSEIEQLTPSVVPKSADYILSINPDKLAKLKPALGETGHLDVISAGLNEKYYERFSDLSLGLLDQEEIVGMGRVLRTWLKSLVVAVKVPDYYGLGETVNVPYDYILIDSRTGISEIGGLCIGPLSDRLVVLTSLNDQNIEGTKEFLDEIGINKRRDVADEPWDNADVPPSSIVPERLGPKPTLLVASPIPRGELKETKKRLDVCHDRIGPISAKISYHPQLSLFETIFVRDWADEYLAEEYLKLTDHLMAIINDHGRQLPSFDADDSESDRESKLERVLRAATHRPADASIALYLEFRTTDVLEASKKVSSDTFFRQADRAFRILSVNTHFDRAGIFEDWGDSLAAQAKRKNGFEADQLFERAGEKYEASLKFKSDNHVALNNWGLALTDHAMQKSASDADQLLAWAGEKYDAAVKMKPDAYEALFNWGISLTIQAKQKYGSDAENLLILAGEKYEASLKIKPDNHEALDKWGYVLFQRAKKASGDDRERLYQLAQEKLLNSESIIQGSSAYNLACLCALQDREEECLNWLQLCRKTGSLSSIQELLSDSDLASVRAKDWFKSFIAETLENSDGNHPTNLTEKASAESAYEKSRPEANDLTAVSVFDVLLEYNSDDKKFVSEIAVELKKQGIKYWIDDDFLRDRTWMQAFQKDLSKTRSVAVFFGPTGLGRYQTLELLFALSKFVESGRSVIPILLPGVSDIPDHFEFDFLKQLYPVRFHTSKDESAIRMLVACIKGDSRS